MPRVLLSPRTELMRNAAAAAANVLTDDALLKLILENHGLYASRFARVCKQWQRAAAAVKLSGQTLETEPHVSCGEYWEEDFAMHMENDDDDANVGPWACSISALPDDNILVADTNNCRMLLLTPTGERLGNFRVPGDFPLCVEVHRGVLHYVPALQDDADAYEDILFRRLRITDGAELPSPARPPHHRAYPRAREFKLAVAPELNRIYLLRFLQPDIVPGCIAVYDLEAVKHCFSFGAFPPDVVTLAYGSSRPSLFVASKFGRISVYDPEGKFLRAFGSPGHEPGSFHRLIDIAVSGDRLFTAEDRGVDFVGRVQVLTLEGLPLQVLPVHTCGGPLSICASAKFVHVICRIDFSREHLLNIDQDDVDNPEEEQEDLGHPMHSLVGFKIRARKP